MKGVSFISIQRLKLVNDSQDKNLLRQT
jgi:hypothetical protein